MTTPGTSAPHDSIPLPRLSDEAAVELYLFVEHLFMLLESRYGDQIRRHFDDRDRHNLLDADPDRSANDPPF
ncbi:hypothetical protein [Roseateles saccharophilus]|uniref:Uncharacterized protein n=1 Tax=Roseateles saccharophilus TaxID=304 RepID=A0A4R3UP83_ROSSA|nr:hypothetical protein [Roseateles saccharophilus]MDG0833482.1 hypothetical protein [Roseateles saccharophilus]TCU92507.1 hypothetical protein EV671_102220 [Roseateles saccharophilus]